MTSTQFSIMSSIFGVYEFVIGYCAALAGFSNNILLSVIFASLCGLGIAAVGIIYILLKQRRNSSPGTFLNESLTRVEEDGSYSLEASSLYEAIEKLGYIEHEMHLEVMKNVEE